MTRGIGALGCAPFVLLSLADSGELAAQASQPISPGDSRRSPCFSRGHRPPIEAKLRPLQQQTHLRRRKVALENLIVATIPREEAAREGIELKELRKRLSATAPAISSDEIDQVNADNAAAFGATSPDEAKERVRLDLETERRMRAVPRGDRAPQGERYAAEADEPAAGRCGSWRRFPLRAA